MTEKLFENDAYLWECEAVVTACEPCKNGFAVELDKTVFFPEGGGQLSDRGKLGEAAVTHVAEEGGRILHFCDKPLAVGSTVKAAVDGVAALRRTYFVLRGVEAVWRKQYRLSYERRAGND